MSSAAWFSPRDFTCYELSERAVTLEFGCEINPETSKKVQNLYFNLIRHPFVGFYAATPAYTSLAVFYDPLKVLGADGLKGNTAYVRVKEYLERLWIQTLGDNALDALADKEKGEIVSIPVRYGGEFGPDLIEVAGFSGMSTDEIVSLHSEQVYEVGMIGFMPGFTYLTGLPDALKCPRKQLPRPLVPAGSVGIAGSQTGIYSLDSPGGWQIIGRITWKLFDPDRIPPVLLKIGDRVRFVEIEHR